MTRTKSNKAAKKRSRSPKSVYIATGAYGGSYIIDTDEIKEALELDKAEVFEFTRGQRVTGVTVTLAKT